MLLLGFFGPRNSSKASSPQLQWSAASPLTLTTPWCYSTCWWKERRSSQTQRQLSLGSTHVTGYTWRTTCGRRSSLNTMSGRSCCGVGNLDFSGVRTWAGESGSSLAQVLQCMFLEAVITFCFVVCNCKFNYDCQCGFVWQFCFSLFIFGIDNLHMNPESCVWIREFVFPYLI